MLLGSDLPQSYVDLLRQLDQSVTKETIRQAQCVAASDIGERCDLAGERDGVGRLRWALVPNYSTKCLLTGCISQLGVGLTTSIVSRSPFRANA